MYINPDVSDTIWDIKRKIESKEGYSTTIQQLKYQGIELENDRSISNYNLRKFCTLNLYLPVDAVLTDGTKKISRQTP